MSFLINDDDRQSLLALASLLALIVVIRFWQVALLLTIGMLLVWLLVRRQRLHNDRMLQRQIDLAHARYRKSVVSINGDFHQLDGIQLKLTPQCRRIELVITHLVSDGYRIEPERRMQLLWEASSGQPPRSINVLINQSGLDFIGPLAVETKALATSLHCIRERAWCETSHARIEEMQEAATTILRKAHGNPLLEEAIPRLEKAIETFEGERQKLMTTAHAADQRLKQLFDFLSVPSTLRPVLTVDLENWDPVQRLKELEQSFNDVVLLNDTFTALSSNALTNERPNA